MIKDNIGTMQKRSVTLPHKYEVAEELGISLGQGRNRDLITSRVGKVGGLISSLRSRNND